MTYEEDMKDESFIPLVESFIKSSICQNCDSLIQYKDEDLYRCKERTEGDLLNSTPQITKLNSHCSLFSPAKRPLKGFNKKKKKTFSGILIENYMQNVENFYDNQPFFYDKSGLFWIWEDYKYKIVDEIDMMNFIEDALGFMGQTVGHKLKSNYMESFKRYGRKKIPKPSKKGWIQFKDKAFSLNSGKTYEVTHDYFFTNPIPWEIAESSLTPSIDKLLGEWVGEKYKETAYEIIAYCCLTDYPIHLIFCLVGAGCNGKSKFLGLINKFIGLENLCSTDLDILLESRFETCKLYKKLVCSLGETNFSIMNKTSMLKKLTGQDMIGYEFKNKQPFDEINYAKILVGSNSLPISGDNSDGFYRRWLILDFPNRFPEGKDILKTIPDSEYNNLAKKVTEILPKLIERGEFIHQGTIEERTARYIMASNPLSFFLKNFCEKGDGLFIKYGELYNHYRQFLSSNKKRRISYKEFNDVLSLEGLYIYKTSKKINEDWVNDRYIEGINVNPEIFRTLEYNSSLSSPSKGKSREYSHKVHESTNQEIQSNVEELMEDTHIKCSICSVPKSKYHFKGKYFCSEGCLEGFKCHTPETSKN